MNPAFLSNVPYNYRDVLIPFFVIMKFQDFEDPCSCHHPRTISGILLSTYITFIFDF